MNVDEVLVHAANSRRFAGYAAFGSPLVILDIRPEIILDPGKPLQSFFLADQFHFTAITALVLLTRRQFQWYNPKNRFYTWRRIMLKVGDKAPDFESKDQNGDVVRLHDLKGQRVVLYFYPKDDTPGCTKEACSFRDADDVYQKKGIKVFGVSTDDEKSHQKFISKFQLPFDLLADTDKDIVEKYGVWGEKSMYGKKYMGTIRKTFLIDEKGNIAKIFDKVNVAEHADEVLEAFNEA